MTSVKADRDTASEALPLTFTSPRSVLSFRKQVTWRTIQNFEMHRAAKANWKRNVHSTYLTKLSSSTTPGMSSKCNLSP
jgi:hypothetical protein